MTMWARFVKSSRAPKITHECHKTNHFFFHVFDKVAESR